MSATAIKTFPVRAFSRMKNACADMNYAQRRLFERRTKLPHDYRTLELRTELPNDRRRAEIEHLEELMRLKPRI